MKTTLALSPKIKLYWIDSKGHYSMKSIEKFINYFFDGMNLTIKCDTDTHANCDGVIYDIQDDCVLPSKKLNVMVCVENCSYWTHYKHYNKYGNYSNDNVKIYLYNHIDKIELTEKYIAIPIIHLQMNYFQKFYNEIKPSCMIPFEHKKFCLIATRLNSHFKIKIFSALMTIQPCDFIHDFKPLIGNKSCYQDIDLLNLFNQYKFVFVSENSVCDGYITEKVFNCFFSRSIPIYYGSMKVGHFFNPGAVIHANGDEFNTRLDRMVEQVKTIKDDKRLFESYTNCKIINDSYDNEQYKDKVNEFIDNVIKP